MGQLIWIFIFYTGAGKGTTERTKVTRWLLQHGFKVTLHRVIIGNKDYFLIMHWDKEESKGTIDLPDWLGTDHYRGDIKPNGSSETLRRVDGNGETNPQPTPAPPAPSPAKPEKTPNNVNPGHPTTPTLPRAKPILNESQNAGGFSHSSC